MTVLVKTRHSEEFDIHTEAIDPALSSYVRTVRDYVARITALYAQLGIEAAIWTSPEEECTPDFETSKPIEYVLELNEDRVVAYINEKSWSDYLYGKHETFVYSRTPTQYSMTSILVAPPIEKAEIKVRRKYRRINGPDKYELVEETRY